MSISADERYGKKTVDVLGKRMAYVDVGSGDPIVFLHGNPTSSYLWRNIIPHVEGQARCIAPDLIGMGDSEKLEPSGPDSYTFLEHSRYLDAFFAGLNLDRNVVLVIHDWGSALGFYWAQRNPTAIRGIAYMESLVQPMTWDTWPPPVVDVFKAFRSDQGEAMILEQNMFVEQILPGAVLRELSSKELEVYRRPYLEPGEGRRPTLTWPRQIPLEGEPKEVVRVVEGYGRWLAQSDIPKLFVNAEPGAILNGPQQDFCRSWPNQTEVTVRGSHFVQEDSPDEIGEALSRWYATLS